MEFITHLLL